MNTVVDIILVVVILLGFLIGAHKGLIKSIVGLIGVVAITIISYALRMPLANFLIDKLPLISIKGVTALSILIYNILAFIVIFILLYCILNIILSLTGFVDSLLKLTVIWVIPSKIGGAIIGFLETWVFTFLVLFVLSQFSFTNSLIKDSKVSNLILNHTPIVGTYLKNSKDAAMDIYAELLNEDESLTTSSINLKILQTEILHGLITKEKAQELIETGKIGLDNVLFGKGDKKWLNI